MFNIADMKAALSSFKWTFSRQKYNLENQCVYVQIQQNAKIKWAFLWSEYFSLTLKSASKLQLSLCVKTFLLMSSATPSRPLSPSLHLIISPNIITYSEALKKAECGLTQQYPPRVCQFIKKPHQTCTTQTRRRARTHAHTRMLN